MSKNIEFSVNLEKSDNSDHNKHNLVGNATQTKGVEDIRVSWGHLLRIAVDLDKGHKRPRIKKKGKSNVLCGDCNKTNGIIDVKNAQIQRLITRIEGLLKQLAVERKGLKVAKAMITHYESTTRNV